MASQGVYAQHLQTTSLGNPTTQDASTSVQTNQNQGINLPQVETRAIPTAESSYPGVAKPKILHLIQNRGTAGKHNYKNIDQFKEEWPARINQIQRWDKTDRYHQEKRIK